MLRRGGDRGADAAGVLCALNRLAGELCTVDELCRMGAQIGADVPFCVRGGCALAEGIGERLTPLAGLPDCTLVVVKPPVGVSTAEAYRRVDAAAGAGVPDAAAMQRALAAGDLSGVGQALGNVFESAMALPEVAAIRAALDENGFVNTPVMAYSAKFASTFYGPFRDAAGSAPAFGDRRSYQMDPHNGREAMRECELDVQEGADILMIKPAMPYLDLVRACRDRFDLPVAAYQVSGEYAMIKAAAKAGLIDEYGVMCESAVSIFRAGADILITYFACELADAIRKGDIG